LSFCQKESQDVIMNNVQDLHESPVPTFWETKKTLAHFIIKIKKDLSDSVERLKIYSQLRLTPPTVRRSCHMIFTGRMEGSRLKARDRWDLQYNILRAISFVFSSGLYLIVIIIFIHHKNIKRTKKSYHYCLCDHYSYQSSSSSSLLALVFTLHLRDLVFWILGIIYNNLLGIILHKQEQLCLIF
jgi:hypothetical protein